MTTCNSTSSSSRFASLRSRSLLRQVLTCLSLCCFVTFFAACSEEPNEAPSAPKELRFEGQLTTSIPAMPSFAPLTVADHVTLEWKDGDHRVATVKLGAFTLQVGMIGKDFAIGEMTIPEVTCTRGADGVVTLTKEAFECQAGHYLTKGRLEGTFAAGQLKLTLHYKPGSMPFECQSVFTSSARP